MTFAQQVQDALSEQAARQIAIAKQYMAPGTITNRASYYLDNAAWLLAAVNNLAVPNATH